MASWRWLVAAALATVVSFAMVVATYSSDLGSSHRATGSGQAPAAHSGALDRLAARHPGKPVEVIVQFRGGTDPAAARTLIRRSGGHVTRDLPIIRGFGVRMPAGKAAQLADHSSVRAVSINSQVEGTGKGRRPDPVSLNSAFIQSIRAQEVWGQGYTGEGVGVAVVDTGIAGDHPDFRESPTDSTSRVVASAVVNPGAQNAGDSYGHGTHIAGLIAGNGSNRATDDPLFAKYSGVAPDANLISVKASDEDGNTTVLDVIDGLQFVVDHKADYNIRVVNLSLRSTSAESYKTDPLDAAAEAAWFNGIVVVAAAGNDGEVSEAVSYAPGNDPYVITVGSVDDQGTKKIDDDKLTSWSSRGKTQDGYVKPEMVAPGAKMVSTMGPSAKYREMCPTCVVDDAYFRVGGTSMSAAVVSGEAADLIEKHPDWTPSQIKGTIVKRTRPVVETVSSMAPGTLVDADGQPVPGDTTVETEIVNAESAADKAVGAAKATATNSGLTPNTLVDPATGSIDYSRASWSRASWSDAADPLRASWSRASWSRASWSRASWSATPQSCSDFERASWSRASWSAADVQYAKDQCSSLLQSVDPTRASWSRASWSRASWSSSFTK